MRFSPSFLDDLRSRVPVSDVVRKSVSLKKQGREWAGLSPFNKEKSPSFFVNDQKGFYHCFSSGKHGDIFDFLIETQGMPFPEAVEQIASLAGIPIPQDTPVQIEVAEKRTRLHKVMEIATHFFEQALKAPQAQAARAYMEERGLTAQICQTFRLGYAPEGRTALKQHLLSHGVSLADAIEAGMLIAGEDIPEPYDRFRDRIMFPIHDLRGQLIAFGGRALSKQAKAKYLNSPETPLFHKGGVLYNHHRARQASHQIGTVIAVEGYMDTIALAKVGISHAVAPLGTALTADQLTLLWRMGDEPILCFDGDHAGQRAAFRAVDTALALLKPGKSLQFVFLPEGQDPDDIARSGGRAAIDGAFAHTQPLVDVLWMRETHGQNLETPERRAALEKRLHMLAATIQDENVRRHYHTALNEKLRSFMAPAAKSFRQPYPQRTAHGFAKGGKGFKNGHPAFEPPLQISANLRNSGMIASSRLPPREATLLLALLHHPDLLEQYGEQIAMVEFSTAELRSCQRALLDLVAHPQIQDADFVRRYIEETLGSTLLLRITNAVAPGTWWVQPEANFHDAQTAFAHTLALHLKTSALHKELVAAEQAFGEDLSEENFARLAEIQSELRNYEGTEALIEGFGVASGRLR